MVKELNLKFSNSFFLIQSQCGVQTGISHSVRWDCRCPFRTLLSRKSFPHASPERVREMKLFDFIMGNERSLNDWGWLQEVSFLGYYKGFHCMTSAAFMK
jgi:hypothetical protein